ncbi:MAG: antitoxin [Desulfococcaceae bacterium]
MKTQNPIKKKGCPDRPKSVPAENPDTPHDLWQKMVESLGKFSEDFMADRDQPEAQERDCLD